MGVYIKYQAIYEILISTYIKLVLGYRYNLV